jgi:hypothetical protein
MKRPDLVHLARAVEGYDLVVALGQVPARALHSIGKAHYALPHPSGLNRKLNDAAFVRESIEGLRAYLHEEHVT